MLGINGFLTCITQGFVSQYWIETRLTETWNVLKKIIYFRQKKGGNKNFSRKYTTWIENYEFCQYWQF